MNSINFLNNRKVNLNTLFSSEEEWEGNEDYNGILNSLANALEKQIRTWWDVQTFEQYLKEKIIMRSLRWEVSPQDGLDDNESTSE